MLTKKFNSSKQLFSPINALLVTIVSYLKMINFFKNLNIRSKTSETSANSVKE